MIQTTDRAPPKVEQGGSVRILTFSPDGVRDVENMLARELKGRTGAPGGHLLLDFTNVTRLGSVELGTLIGLHKRMQACGGRLTLFNLNAEIYEIFTATSLQTILGICTGTGADAADARAAVAAEVNEQVARAGAGGGGDADKYVECE